MMKRFLILLTLLLAMMFSCSQLSENNNSINNIDNGEIITTGKIVGKATYTNTSNHAGIQVTLVSSDGIVAYDSQISSRSRSAVAVMKNVVTSENGEYSFDNVKEGVYTIYASSDDSTEKAVLTNVVVQANQVVTAADLNLTATGSICGRVTLDSKEDENLGITVVIAGTSYMAVTDSFGFFTISDIPAGSGYQIVIMKGDYCTIWKKVSVEAGKENNLGDKNISSQKVPTDTPSNTDSFIWQGSFAVSPANPEKYWAYFNTTDGCSYIYDGAQWTLLAQAGADGKDGADGKNGIDGEDGKNGTDGKNGIDGIDGVTINWRGSFATSPANPEKYWAYFDTDDGCSYIYDGTQWTLLAQAGADGEDGENGNGGGASVEHKIIYELNGGTNNTKNPNSFLEYLTVNLRSPTRDGYYFAGWYENADFSGNRIKGWEIGEKRTDVTLYAKWTTDVSFSRIYSYTLNIKDISEAWGGTTVSPSFSVVLLTDEQVEVCKAASDFKQAPADNPEYQLGAYGSMKITDTSKTGDYAVYGANPVNDVYQYYNGVAATITNTTFTLTVDMTKIVKTDLRGLWKNTGNGDEAVMTNDDIVDLIEHKPYVIALGDYLVYEDNYVFTAWSADVMKMAEGATFPTELIEDAPKDPTLSDMTVVCSNFGNFPITFTDGIATCEIEYSLVNEMWRQDGIEFGICNNESWGERYTGAEITVLDKAVALTYNASNNNKVAGHILTDGNIYVLTIDAKAKTVKVTETGSKVTAISVNSASHKTTYNFAESLDVSGLTIEVTRDDGTTKTVNVTSSMVSGFNPLELGTQTLTITYGGCTTTFDVEVHEIETETVEATASNVYDKISGLSSGYYLLKVSGEITSSTIADITSAMDYTSAKIILDLSDTTGLTSIGSSNFWGCRNLISITLPDGLTSIGSDAFTDCSNLINVVIPESVTEIGHDAFKYCSKLISAEIPEGVTTINEQTFAYCSSLTSVTIPESVTYIDYSAFQQCSSLTTVNYRGTQEQWEQIVIDYDNTYLKNASVNYNYTGSVLGKVTGITINSTSHKVSYNAGESLDVSGLTIEVTKEDATTKTVKVSSSMVSGFNSLELGTQTLTITYSRCTTTFDVEVIGTAYTIAFDANGGSGTMESLTVIENIIYKLDDEPFTAPDGYVFNSWNTKADGSGKTYYMNNSYSFSNDMTLYAVWEKVENNFDVSLPGSTSFSIYQSTDGDNVTFSCDYWRNYDSYTWYIDGVKQTSTSEEMTVDTSTMKAGIYTVMLKVKSDGKYWAETTTLKVKK